MCELSLVVLLVCVFVMFGVCWICVHICCKPFEFVFLSVFHRCEFVAVRCVVDLCGCALMYGRFACVVVFVRYLCCVFFCVLSLCA